jgi:hypothetical protein
LHENKKTQGSVGRVADGLRKSLLSIGVDEKSAAKLLASKALDRIVVPVYWKDGLVSQSHALWLSKLPNFLKSFDKEFPDGQARWDPDYDEQGPMGNPSSVAIRIHFNYQEDDDGDHWSPKPTAIEDQSYQRMLRRFSYVGTGALQAHAVLHAK